MPSEDAKALARELMVLLRKRASDNLAPPPVQRFMLVWPLPSGDESTGPYAF